MNVVLTRQSFRPSRRRLARARALGAVEAQLLRYKPAGRAATLEYLAARLSTEQARALGPTLRRLSRAHCHGATLDGFHLRIDCAFVAFLSADEERRADDPGALARFGIYGCEAGGALAAFTVDGRVAPCSFAGSTGLAALALADHGRDPELSRWRAYLEAPPEPCASCSLRAVCKGGCKVVAGFVDGVHGPDPECPRVVDARLAPAHAS